MANKLALLVSYDGTPYRGWTDVRDAALRPTLAKVLGLGDSTPPRLEAARAEASDAREGPLAPRIDRLAHAEEDSAGPEEEAKLAAAEVRGLKRRWPRRRLGTGELGAAFSLEWLRRRTSSRPSGASRRALSRDRATRREHGRRERGQRGLRALKGAVCMNAKAENDDRE